MSVIVSMQYFNWNKQIRKDFLSLIYKNKNKHKFIKRNIGVLLLCHYLKVLSDIANYYINAIDNIAKKIHDQF